MAIVFQFRVWDTANDEYKISYRWATAEAIKKIGGETLGEGVEVADSVLGREIAGMTERGFQPGSPSPYSFR